MSLKFNCHFDFFPQNLGKTIDDVETFPPEHCSNENVICGMKDLQYFDRILLVLSGETSAREYKIKISNIFELIISFQRLKLCSFHK